MAFQLSPGVNVSEVDLTTVVPSVATTVGGLAGNFTWGPVDEVTIVTTEIRLVDTFGKPDANTLFESVGDSCFKLSACILLSFILLDLIIISWMHVFS